MTNKVFCPDGIIKSHTFTIKIRSISYHSYRSSKRGGGKIRPEAELEAEPEERRSGSVLKKKKEECDFGISPLYLPQNQTCNTSR